MTCCHLSLALRCQAASPASVWMIEGQLRKDNQRDFWPHISPVQTRSTGARSQRVFMCDSLRKVNWSCSKSPVSRVELLAIGGRPKEKVRDEAELCSGTTEQKQTREEELFPHQSPGPRESLQLPALRCLMNFQQLKKLMVANTQRQPLAYPRYRCRGARLHLAWFRKDRQRPVGMGWS